MNRLKGMLSRKPAVGDHYTLGNELGKGTFSVVREGYHKKTGEKFAVKVINRKAVGEKTEMIDTEIAILKRVAHPHIVTMKELFEASNEIYLVMELVTGGELFDKIVELGCYREVDARELVKQILGACAYLHDHDIVHRDLKPENLLLSDDSVGAGIKIADFGLSKVVGGSSMLQTACGTPGYVAPEVLKCEGYGSSVDMWSIGVIMYILLCGFPPFYEENTAALFEQIMEGRFDFPAPYWEGISEAAKDLIRRLLVVDPAGRLSAKEALAHPWLTGQTASTHHMAGMQDEMRRYNLKRRFRAGVIAAQAVSRMSKAAGITPKAL